MPSEKATLSSNTDTPGGVAPADAPAEDGKTQCARCGRATAVDEDGFCGDCSKLMEQACL